MEMDDSTEHDEMTDAASSAVSSLTGFLFGNIDEKGELQEDFLDEPKAFLSKTELRRELHVVSSHYARQTGNKLNGHSMLKKLCPLLFRTRSQLSCSVLQWQNYHTTQTRMADFDPIEEDSDTGKKFLSYNDIVYPPQKPGEPARPAEICHMRANIRGNKKYMWYGAVMVRGLSVDEAIKQCSFHKKNYAQIIKEVIQEAQEMAVRDHNVEYKSNLWVADSFCTKGKILKGKRLHAMGRMGKIHFQFCHYFVRLREGTPPKHYYPPEPTGNEKMEEYIKQQRSRKILDSL